MHTGQSNSAPWRLLVLSCSSRKRPDAGNLRALDRYDGPTFRLVRKFISQDTESAPNHLRVFILSAAYGLVDSDHPTPAYDFVMSPERARDLRSGVTRVVSEVVAGSAPVRVLVCAGRTYLDAFADAATMLSAESTVVVAGGSDGNRMARLHDWLYGHAPVMSVRRRDRVLFRGMQVDFSKAELIASARAQLRAENERVAAQRYHAWYVPIDGLRVAPKWLLSVMTGKPVAAFSTTDARRVLEQLGIHVERV